jgi:hypothetical protein
VDQVTEDRVGEPCGTHGRGEKSVKDLVGKPEGMRSLGRPRLTWMVSEWLLEILAGRVWSGFNWLRVRAGGGML